MRKAANASPYLRDQEAIGEFLANHSDAILELVRAADALEERMEELRPKLTGAFGFLAVHDYKWDSDDNWAKEKDALSAALSKLNGEQM